MAIQAEIVIFRIWPGGDVTALWPYLIVDWPSSSYCQSYEHIGQHGAADYHYVIKQTRPAKENEYADLLKELQSLGYDPVIRKRRQRR